MRWRFHHLGLDDHLRLRLRPRLRLRLRLRRLLQSASGYRCGDDQPCAETQGRSSHDAVPITEPSGKERHASMLSGNFVRHPVGGGGRESNPPATILAAKPVLKTGGATGPLPPPPLFISNLRRPVHSEVQQRHPLVPTLFTSTHSRPL